MIKDRRLWILALLLAAIAFEFWTGSRYPSLDVKSTMGGAVALQDSLSFEAVFDARSAPNLAAKTLYTFANWVHVNWKGMAFGLAIALLLITGLPLLRGFYSKSRFGSTLIGSLIGIPLGLCVNCSAPIAYGIVRGGGRTETALAAMLSSPTLNVIVLSMSIAMFPVYLWATKVLLSLLLIFVFLPLLVLILAPSIGRSSSKNPPSSLSPRLFGTSPELPSLSPAPPSLSPELRDLDSPIKPCLSIPAAIRWLLPELWRNLRTLTLKMLPLMFIAGLIGAALVSLLPWDRLIDLVPTDSLRMLAVGMALLACFALILPVPIAFDVVLVVTLISAGLPPAYAGVLLFALGSFSIYSFFVLIKAGLKRIAIFLSLCIWGLSILAGVISHVWGQVDANRQKALWMEMLKTAPPTSVWRSDLEPIKFGEVKTAPAMEKTPFLDSPQILEIALSPASRADDSGTNTWEMALTEVGFQTDPAPVFWSNLQPYSAFNPLAAADINDDGWPDVVRGGYGGVQIYTNTGGQFSLVENTELADFDQITSLALADLNNDGYPDLIFTQFSGEKYLSYNHSGQFAAAQKLAGPSPAYAPAIAIADLDNNGELDLIFGNQTIADLLNISLPASKNSIYFQHDSTFTQAETFDLPGSTLSLLVSDLDQDNRVDVLVGNDFDTPDRYYAYDPTSNHFEPWSSSAVDEVTLTTMSIDSADINNDLQLEIYLAQISMQAPDKRTLAVESNASVLNLDYLFLIFGTENPFGELAQSNLDTCSESTSTCTQKTIRKQINAAVWSQDLSKCSLLDNLYIWQCAATAMQELSYMNGRFGSDGMLCDELGSEFPEISVLCEQMRAAINQPKKPKLNNELSVPEHAFNQNSLTNILLSRNNPSKSDNAKPKYLDIAEETGIQYAGWSWNAKFADLDGDQWQDLFVANGWYQMRADTSNVFFRNIEGRHFEIETESSGLLDYSPTTSYLYLDIDLDADLDIVTSNIYGETKAYLNHNNNQHIQVTIDDRIGNRAGVGASIVLQYGADRERHQIREIKLSGGYQSFDPSIAHFGLGKFPGAEQLRLSFPDGRRYIFDGEFKAGHQYRLRID